MTCIGIEWQGIVRKPQCKARTNRFGKNGFWFTRRRLQIFNFTTADEDLYMCIIRRSTDDYVAEKEIFLALKGKKCRVFYIPDHAVFYYRTGK